jgi:hypothetical protein
MVPVWVTAFGVLVAISAVAFMAAQLLVTLYLGIPG